ncbi:hypothetical protein F6Y03_02630 [Bacillus megaterium]|nr:hypothetical protein [Priestia megaterium NBRC 15308 = ATCC 14581]NGY81073.1 hypothetical protein [Priestia megaterium]
MSIEEKASSYHNGFGSFYSNSDICATRDSIIKIGEKCLGRRYSYGASIADLSKFNCSSFSAQAFKENGITLPRVSSD